MRVSKALRSTRREVLFVYFRQLKNLYHLVGFKVLSPISFKRLYKELGNIFGLLLIEDNIFLCVFRSKCHLLS